MLWDELWDGRRARAMSLGTEEIKALVARIRAEVEAARELGPTEPTEVELQPGSDDARSHLRQRVHHEFVVLKAQAGHPPTATEAPCKSLFWDCRLPSASRSSPGSQPLFSRLPLRSDASACP